jgi:23S rRNA (uridine2552-2'-O)-methyltransferase
MRKNRWDDSYARRAREEKWLARSVYKLEEIDRKFRLIRKGHRVLDLGCYPGSWSQYGIRKVGPKGDVVGIDLTPPERLASPRFRYLKADVLILDPEGLRREVGPKDVILSDLAPQTTGIRLTDASRSMALARKALELAQVVLEGNGNFVCKVFEGEDLKAFTEEAAPFFRVTRLFRPSAVRKGSREVYLLGIGFRMSRKERFP